MISRRPLVHRHRLRARAAADRCGIRRSCHRRGRRRDHGCAAGVAWTPRRQRKPAAFGEAVMEGVGMRPNAIRQKLASGQNVMGMMHFTASPMIVEVMASAGLDFFIIDFEHSPIDITMAAHLVRAGDAAGIAPLLRIPEVDVGLVKKVAQSRRAGHRSSARHAAELAKRCCARCVTSPKAFADPAPRSARPTTARPTGRNSRPRRIARSW